MQTPLASDPMYSTGNFPMLALQTARKRARNMLMMTARVRLRMRKSVVQSSLSRYARTAVQTFGFGPNWMFITVTINRLVYKDGLKGGPVLLSYCQAEISRNLGTAL